MVELLRLWAKRNQMSRRQSLLEDVMSLPWPLGVVLAIIVFAGSQFLFSRPNDSVVVAAIYPGFLTMGKVLSGLFLIAAFMSFLT